MSTPCCQISTPYRLVVSEYEVPKVFVCKSDTFFLVHPVQLNYYIIFPKMISRQSTTGEIYPDFGARVSGTGNTCYCFTNSGK